MHALSTIRSQQSVLHSATSLRYSAVANMGCPNCKNIKNAAQSNSGYGSRDRQHNLPAVTVYSQDNIMPCQAASQRTFAEAAASGMQPVNHPSCGDQTTMFNNRIEKFLEQLLSQNANMIDMLAKILAKLI